MVDMTRLPGSPPDLKSQAAQLIAAAANLGEASDHLRNVATFHGYQSASVKEASRNATEIKGAIDKAEIRYRGAGEQISRWADDLEDLQKKADQAIADWNGIDVAGPTSAVSSAQDDVNAAALLSDERGEAKDHLRDMKVLLDQANAQRADAERRLREAREELDWLAKHHAGVIRKNNEASGLDDSLWDKIKNWVANLPWDKILEVIKAVAEWVALITTVVGFVLMFTPLAPFGAALLLLGRIASAVSVAVSIIQFLTGKLTLGELIVGALLAAAGGLGKVLKLGKLATLGKKSLLAKPGKLIKDVKKAAKNERMRQTVKRKVKAGELTRERGDHYRDMLNRNQLRDVTDLPVRQVGESAKDYAERAVVDRVEGAVKDAVTDVVIDNAANVIDNVTGGWSVDVGAVVDSGDFSDLVTSGNSVEYSLPSVDVGVIPGVDLSLGMEPDFSSGGLSLDLPAGLHVPIAVVSVGEGGVKVPTPTTGAGGGGW